MISMLGIDTETIQQKIAEINETLTDIHKVSDAISQGQKTKDYLMNLLKDGMKSLPDENKKILTIDYGNFLENKDENKSIVSKMLSFKESTKFESKLDNLIKEKDFQGYVKCIVRVIQSFEWKHTLTITMTDKSLVLYFIKG